MIIDGPKVAKAMGSVPLIPKAVVNFDRKNKKKPNKKAPDILSKIPPCL